VKFNALLDTVQVISDEELHHLASCVVGIRAFKGRLKACLFGRGQWRTPSGVAGVFLWSWRRL